MVRMVGTGRDLSVQVKEWDFLVPFFIQVRRVRQHGSPPFFIKLQSLLIGVFFMQIFKKN